EPFAVARRGPRPYSASAASRSATAETSGVPPASLPCDKGLTAFRSTSTKFPVDGVGCRVWRSCSPTAIGSGTFKARDRAWVGRERMKFIISLCAMALLGASAAQAQVELNTYADSKGNLDIQKLTCGQLANTFQEDADFMTVWYSGWYNGL